MSEKYTFNDFLSTVDGDNREFVRELHEELTKLGCKTEIKQAKSGYVVSCLQNKKTILNYVFRRKGLMVRIYPNHLADYMEVFDTISDELAKAIRTRLCANACWTHPHATPNAPWATTLS